MLILWYVGLGEHWWTEGGTEAFKDSDSENDGDVGGRKVELMATSARWQSCRTLHFE